MGIVIKFIFALFKGVPELFETSIWWGRSLVILPIAAVTAFAYRTVGVLQPHEIIVASLIVLCLAGAAVNVIADFITKPRRRYNISWENESYSKLQVWQAACLWVGKEPRRKIESGNDEYAIANFILMSDDLLEIPIANYDQRELDRWVSRDKLREFAKHRKPKPVYPF